MTKVFVEQPRLQVLGLVITTVESHSRIHSFTIFLPRQLPCYYCLYSTDRHDMDDSMHIVKASSSSTFTHFSLQQLLGRLSVAMSVCVSVPSLHLSSSYTCVFTKLTIWLTVSNGMITRLTNKLINRLTDWLLPTDSPTKIPCQDCWMLTSSRPASRTASAAWHHKGDMDDRTRIHGDYTVNSHWLHSHWLHCHWLYCQ